MRLSKRRLQTVAPAPRCVLVKVHGYWYRMPSLPRMTWCRGSTLRDAGPAPERGRRRRDAASSAERLCADAPSDAGRVTVACTRSPCPQGGRARRGEALREAPHRGARTRTLVDGPCCSTVVTTTAVVHPFTGVGRPSVQRGRAAARAENRGPRVLNVPSGTRVAGARHVPLAHFVLGLSHLVAPRGHGLRGRSLGEFVHPVPGLCVGAPLRSWRCELSRHRKGSPRKQQRTRRSVLNFVHRQARCADGVILRITLPLVWPRHARPARRQPRSVVRLLRAL